MIEIRSRDHRRELVEACAHDFGRFAFDGFGIMLSDQQLEFQEQFGHFGPRRPGEEKFWWLSGGQRAGKTVLGALIHADGCLYKRGLDNTDRIYWQNYAYGTLAIAPIEQLAMRLYFIMDEISKGANDAQWDAKARRSRGGHFRSKMKAGKAGQWPIVRFTNGAFTDFRSSEGRAYRLEGGQWWGCTWDEWASQPDHEIKDVVEDVLPGRLRDHDAKLLAMAWPKPETEHHIISRKRAIEGGRDRDSRIYYLAADQAHFTNRDALEVERRMKDKARWQRTVLGQPAGGAAIEFKTWMIDNAKIELGEGEMFPDLPANGYTYLNSWDLGAARDATVGFVWRIPVINGVKIVTPAHKARIVNVTRMSGSAAVTVDTVSFAIGAQQALYRALSAIDAQNMGGVYAVRALRDLDPPVLEFKSRANDRLWGNMRVAAITNGLEMMTWGRPDQKEIAAHAHEPGWLPEEYSGGAWGLIELPDVPELVALFDQLLSFDRDNKHIPDDEVWALLIGAWYIRRYYVRGEATDHTPVSLDPKRRRSKLIGQDVDPIVALGTRAKGQDLTDAQKDLLARGRPVVRWSRPGR